METNENQPSSEVSQETQEDRDLHLEARQRPACWQLSLRLQRTRNGIQRGSAVPTGGRRSFHRLERQRTHERHLREGVH